MTVVARTNLTFENENYKDVSTNQHINLASSAYECFVANSAILRTLLLTDLGRRVEN